MGRIFRRPVRQSEPTDTVREDTETGEAGLSALAFQRPGRAAGTTPPNAGGERDDAGVARLRDELRRERAEKAQALAAAERRLVRALAEQRSELEVEKAQALAEAERQLVDALTEQRSEMEEEARELLVEVARLREELERERAEIQAELAAIRRQRSETEPQLAAIVQASARAVHG